MRGGPHGAGRDAKIDPDFIERGAVISTRNVWRERLSWLHPHLVASFDDLEARRQSTEQTIGVIRPTRMLGLDITPVSDETWSEKELESLQQQGLFDTPEQARRAPLRKMPVDFHYRYECSGPDGATEHRHKITDWEVGALYWRCRRDHGDGWEEKVREKLEIELPGKDLMFVMGTVHRFPGQWLIIGLIYPPRVAAPDTSQLMLDVF